MTYPVEIKLSRTYVTWALARGLDIGEVVHETQKAMRLRLVTREQASELRRDAERQSVPGGGRGYDVVKASRSVVVMLDKYAIAC